MASLSKKSFIWISSTLPNPVLTELRNLSDLISSISIYQSEKSSNYLKKGSKASYSATKQFKNGVAYNQTSTGSMGVNSAIQTALDFDAGRIVPSYDERFEITALTGHYSNGNGTYKMSTNFKNDNVVYFNENKWAIWYDSDKTEWVLTNELTKHPSRTNYEFILRNGNDKPTAGTYMSLDGSQKGYTPSSIGNQVVVSVPVFSYSSPITKVSTCNTHTLFLDKTNTAWAVGLNSDYQLGDNSTKTSTLPRKLSKHDVMDISVSDGHSFITKLDGSVWVVGLNRLGKSLIVSDLADKPDRTDYGVEYRSDFGAITSLTKATNGGQDDIALQIKSSYTNTYMLKYENIDGVKRKNLYAYGSNQFGQLVTGNYFGSSSHGSQNHLVTSDSFRNDIQFDSGFNFLMWIRQGELYGSGAGVLGQVGAPGRSIYTNDINGISRPKPWGDINAVKVNCGYDFSVVLLEDKTLWACGNRTQNQFPTATTGSRDVRAGSLGWVVYGFAKVGEGGVKDFEVGDRHMIVLMEDGRLLSSGDNRLGQRGLGYASPPTRQYSGKFDPVLVDGKPVTSGVSYIHVNGNSTFFVMDDDLYAVGYNKYGNLGDGSTTSIVKSTKVYPTG